MSTSSPVDASPARASTPTSRSPMTYAAPTGIPPATTLASPTYAPTGMVSTTASGGAPPLPPSGSPPPFQPMATSPTRNTQSTAAVQAPLTHSPTHPTATATQAPALPPSNPKVAELQVMFPTVDPGVIEIVLESCGGSQDRAIEQLLSMTDENFRPDELHSARREEESQLDLDAQFARSLQMQDEEEQRRLSRSQVQPGYAGGYEGAGTGAGNDGGGYLPYQPWVRRSRPPQQGGGAAQQAATFPDHEYALDRGGENPPGMLAMEDKLEKFAEAGKQTFNSLLSRAKAKYSEFQAQQAQQAEQRAAQERMQQQAQVSANAGGRGGSSAAGNGAGWNQQVPGGARGGQQNYGYGGRRGTWEDSRSFDSRSESIDSESTSDPPPSQPQPTLRQSPARWQPSDAYDDPAPMTRTAGSPANRIDINSTGRRSPAIGSPEKPAPGRIDPAKLGILPKKRVDLLSTSPGSAVQARDESDPNPSLPSADAPRSIMSKIPATPPATSPYRIDESDDELEYTR